MGSASTLIVILLTGALARPALARKPLFSPWGWSGGSPTCERLPCGDGEASAEDEGEGGLAHLGDPLWLGRPELKKALDAMQGKGWSVALKALKQVEGEGALAGAVAYLKGRCLAELGRTEAALEALRAAKPLIPGLAGYIAVAEVKALREAERYDEADEAIKAVPPAHPGYPKLNLKAAKTMLKRRRYAAAVALTARVTPHLTRQWFLARFALIGAEAQLGIDGDEAAWRGRMAEILRRWSRYRAGADAEAALLDGLVAPSDRDPKAEVSPFTLAEWAGRAVHHIRKKETLRARAIVKAVERAWPEDSAGLADLVAGWRLLKKSPFDALKRATAGLEAVTSSSVRRHLMHLKAEGLRRSGKLSPAIKLYRKLARTMPASEMKASLLWDGGELARRLGRYAVARDLYSALAELPPETPLLQEKLGRVLWEAAWARYRLDDLDGADAWLRRLINDRPMETDSARRPFYERATYWRARIHQRQGRLREARALWGYLVERYPLSYYATLSGHWLGRTGRAAPREVERRLPQQAYSSDQLAAQLPGLGPQEQAVALLWRLGLKRDARLALKRLHALGEISPAGLDFASALYREADNLWISHWLMKKSEPLLHRPGADPRRRWQASFPTPFREIVHAEAGAQGIDPMLVWAIMRQESGFRPRIKSYANAYGLMQLLKGTARMMARKHLGERRAPSVQDLYTPEANIRYGAAFLARLLARYDGHPALAIAAYNAGPGRVNRWLDRVGDLDVDEFVEEIPFDQTRAYTRTVLRSYAAYRALYGQADHTDIYIPLKLRRRISPDTPVAATEPAP